MLINHHRERWYNYLVFNLGFCILCLCVMKLRTLNSIKLEVVCIYQVNSSYVLKWNYLASDIKFVLDMINLIVVLAEYNLSWFWVCIIEIYLVL